MGKIKVDLEKFENAPMYNRFVVEPSPSVCVSGKFDITNLFKYKKKGHIFNAMLCYCVLQAAQKIKEFHYSIKEDGLYYYDYVKTNAVVRGNDGQLYYADYKYFDNFKDFEQEYKRSTEYCKINNTSFIEDTGALIGTSAMIQFPFTAISCDVSPSFWDNFMMWGGYEKKFCKKVLYMSLRFHHATVAGQDAARFFKELQNQIKIFKA